MWIDPTDVSKRKPRRIGGTPASVYGNKIILSVLCGAVTCGFCVYLLVGEKMQKMLKDIGPGDVQNPNLFYDKVRPYLKEGGQPKPIKATNSTVQ